ncbi:MAG: hypothetical protein AAF849_13970 [Bacteroidota bacterium]
MDNMLIIDFPSSTKVQKFVVPECKKWQTKNILPAILIYFFLMTHATQNIKLRTAQSATCLQIVEYQPHALGVRLVATLIQNTVALKSYYISRTKIY